MRQLCISFLLFLAPAAAAADLNGLWVGYYEYENGVRVPCSVALVHGEGLVVGAMVEPQTFGEELDPGKPAYVVGSTDGNSLDFEKYYASDDSEGSGVTYELRISPDGHTMTGFWQVGGMNGRAWFRRVNAANIERLPVPN